MRKFRVELTFLVPANDEDDAQGFIDGLDDVIARVSIFRGAVAERVAATVTETE